MRPAWLARTLVWAGALLFLYWGVLENQAEGAAFAVGLMLGAGSLVYNGRPRPVPLVLATTVLVAGAELLLPSLLKNAEARPASFFFGYFLGILSPFIAWRLSGSGSPR